MDIKDFIAAIEPLQATTAQASPEEDLQLMSITSLAVSAKRIADQLERLADVFEATTSTLNGGGRVVDVRSFEE